jgi:hypothetical protein
MRLQLDLLLFKCCGATDKVLLLAACMDTTVSVQDKCSASASALLLSLLVLCPLLLLLLPLCL